MALRANPVKLSHQLTDAAHGRPVVSALKDLASVVNSYANILPDLSGRVDALAEQQLTLPQIRTALAPTGTAPLATGSPLAGGILAGPHTSRPTSAAPNTLYWETDRRLLYVYLAAWTYAAGVLRTTLTGSDPEPGTESSDGGATAAGVAAAAVDGHPAGAYDGSANRAGLIIGGVALEYPALVAATADQITRDANALELLLRIIYHLQLDGYVAGRQRNPSGLLSNDKIALVEDGVLRAMDIFTGVYTGTLVVQAIQISPANLVEDAGIAD